MAELGGHGNVARIARAVAAALRRRDRDPDAANPWYFPNEGDYRGLLESHGFVVNQIALFPRPTPLPGDLVAWLSTFAGSFTATVREAERLVFLQEVQEALRPVLCDAQGVWTVDYVRLRFAATKPV